uniref:Coat protein n=1 Tax=pepper chlorosis associated virus TaxID=2966369 RepID=A0AA96SZY6_9VIRU|nr:coat protein [pepper chlorosis associated virus]
MSGKLSVENVLDIARTPVWSAEQKEVLKSLKVVSEDESTSKEKMDILKIQERKNPKALVYVTEEGDLKFVDVVESSGVKDGEDTETVISDKKIKFSVEALNKIIIGKSLSLDQDKIKDVLEKYVKELPKTVETYKAGDVLIKNFKGVSTGISSLLAAGTKILDAILYVAYQDSLEHSFIFKKVELSPDMISSREIAENIDIGNKAIKAAFCHVYNQGGLPSSSSESKLLSKFIRETIFKKKTLESDKFCEYLSSSDPSFFPASVFLKVPLDNLPTEVSSRCKMSIAGNKAIRYAMLAQKFEKRTLEDPTKVESKNMLAYIKENEKLQKAISIMNTLSSLGSNFEAQKRMHPLSPERPSRKNFTLQLTCAIVYALSKYGRETMRKDIDDRKIASFKRDLNIYGEVNNIHEAYFPVLTNPDGDFSELSVEAVKTAYGLTM